MIIEGRHLTESERLQWLADHRQEDELLLPDLDSGFDPIRWHQDPNAVGGLPEPLRHYPCDPLAAHETDDIQRKLNQDWVDYTPAEKRSRAFWRRLAGDIGIAVLLTFLGLIALAGLFDVNLIELLRF